MTRRLSRHFTIWEATRSEIAARLGLDNTPNRRQLEHLRWTAQHLLDPVRERFGAIRITSGFRSRELNARTPGSSDSSAHPDGRALDFEPIDRGISLRAMTEWIAASELPFDQLIYEYSAWIHIGAPLRCDPGLARRQVMMKFAGTRYLPFDAADPRVR